MIAKRRRALLVYGVGHLQRKNVLSTFEIEDWRAQTIVSLIERSGPTRVFTIIGNNSREVQEAAACPTPCVLPIKGTTLGAIDASQYFGPPSRFAVLDGKVVPVAADQWQTLPAEDQFDALLYPVPTTDGMPEPLSTRLCTEPGHVDMRLSRIGIAGLPPAEAERVKRLCAASQQE